MSDPIDTSNSAGPHGFRALRIWDYRTLGRCASCYLPHVAHPVAGWVPSRPIGDRRPAEVSWESLGYPSGAQEGEA